MFLNLDLSEELNRILFICFIISLIMFIIFSFIANKLIEAGKKIQKYIIFLLSYRGCLSY